jgi:hypothetical protein
MALDLVASLDALTQADLRAMTGNVVLIDRLGVQADGATLAVPRDVVGDLVLVDRLGVQPPEGHVAFDVVRVPLAAVVVGRLGVLCVAEAVAFAVMFTGGAAIHVAIVVNGTETYRHFADPAFIPFVKQAWASAFMPHAAVLGLLLAAFELAVGLLILAGARKTTIGLVAAIAFHLGLMLFGWGFWFWSVPMLAMLVALLRFDFGSALGPRHNQRMSRRV